MDDADYRALTAQQRSAAAAFHEGVVTREEANRLLRALGLRSIPMGIKSDTVALKMVGVTCRRFAKGQGTIFLPRDEATDVFQFSLTAIVAMRPATPSDQLLQNCRNIRQAQN